MMNRDLIQFSKQIISSRFKALPRFGLVFDRWKSENSKLTDRNEIVKVLDVKKDLPFILPFLTITPMTVLYNHPPSILETIKVLGLSASLTFASLLVLPTMALILPSTIPTDLKAIYYIPVLNQRRASIEPNLYKALVNLLPPSRQEVLKTRNPNWISLSPKLKLTEFPKSTLLLMSRYYGMNFPRLFSFTRLYQHADWIVTDDYLLTTQRVVLSGDDLTRALSDRGYNTDGLTRDDMQTKLMNHLKISEGLRRGKKPRDLGLDSKFEMLVIFTLMATVA